MIHLVRTWLPAAICLAGVVLLAIRRDETGLEGAAALIGAGLSVWFLNVLYRIGVSGDRERSREDAAREHLSRHGRWPDD